MLWIKLEECQKPAGSVRVPKPQDPIGWQAPASPGASTKKAQNAQCDCHRSDGRNLRNASRPPGTSRARPATPEMASRPRRGANEQQTNSTEALNSTMLQQ